MNINLLNIFLICICTFGIIYLIVIVVIRTSKLKNDTEKINKRLKFWMSEKAYVSNVLGVEEEV